MSASLVCIASPPEALHRCNSGPLCRVKNRIKTVPWEVKCRVPAQEQFLPATQSLRSAVYSMVGRASGQPGIATWPQGWAGAS